MIPTGAWSTVRWGCFCKEKESHWAKQQSTSTWIVSYNCYRFVADRDPKRNFSPKQPNRVWCTDFTYVTLTDGTMRYSKGYPKKPDFALGSMKSVYFRRVCTTLPRARNFSKHEPWGLSVWQSADGTRLQYLKDRADLCVSFWNCSRTDYAVSEFSYDWYNQVRPHSYNGYLTPFEKRSECSIKQ